MVNKYVVSFCLILNSITGIYINIIFWVLLFDSHCIMELGSDFAQSR